MKQNTQEWRDARKGLVTGSVAGSILGLSPDKTKDDTMRRMVREYHGEPEEIDPFLQDTIFAYGKHHEAGALLEFRMETGLIVDPCGFFKHAMWLGASPDGLVGSNAVAEIKCPYGKRNDTKPVFKTVLELPHYHAQMQIEMYCSGRRLCHFYQWAPQGRAYEVVGYDHRWIQANLPLLREFYDEYLAEINNKDHLLPLRVEIDTPLALKLLSEYDAIKDSEDQLKERKIDILAQFVGMSSNKNANICGRSLTLVSKKGNISYAKLVKEKLPNINKDDWRGKPTEYWLLK